jgi:hypothetical protein
MHISICIVVTVLFPILSPILGGYVFLIFCVCCSIAFVLLWYKVSRLFLDSYVNNLIFYFYIRCLRQNAKNSPKSKLIGSNGKIPKMIHILFNISHVHICKFIVMALQRSMYIHLSMKKSYMYEWYLIKSYILNCLINIIQVLCEKFKNWCEYIEKNEFCFNLQCFKRATVSH